jgi:hypothetical protein
MTALELEIMRRNALLSAWREVGVPVEPAPWLRNRGPWHLGGADRRVQYFDLRCTACGDNTATVRGWRETAEETQQRVIREAIESGCHHLTPLLSPPPPEVLALASLLMLEARL